MQNRRRFAPTIFLVQKPFSKNCGIHCTKFECILKATLIPTNRTRGARGDSKLPRTLVSFRHCLAEPRQPRKKNTPCFLDLAGVKFLLKKERVFFFRGSALQVFGQCGGAKCGLGKAEIFFFEKTWRLFSQKIKLFFRDTDRKSILYRWFPSAHIANLLCKSFIPKDHYHFISTPKMGVPFFWLQ